MYLDRRSDFPTAPSTVPDEMVSFIMEKAYGYSPEKCQEIKIEHQYSMCAENCVGNLLERYIHEQLKDYGWSWCCGDFVRAIDFIYRQDDSSWILLQIKNRDNSENSSSSAIRDGTSIQKWFRSFSKDTKKRRTSFTRWDQLPNAMQGYGLSENGFKRFVASYLDAEKAKLNSMRAELEN
ncbi:SinI family restriction endonuclease [Picosynechococcus sp. PCC 73109]|uniref:SinI family restriction endonuclease n=1 Tax=Picosynechococcus sp. PCC 73109 TaxID=374982 RepID=UPI0028F44340|nr:SinI family restriction endonuclease [Picosynechococcus sp. PCC 73109]